MTNVNTFEVQIAELQKTIFDLHKNKHLSLKLITATDERSENGCFKIWYIFTSLGEKIFIVPFIQLKNIDEFPSVTPIIHAASNHERKVRTFFGLTPKGHPDQRAIILHENWPSNIFPLRKDFDWDTRPNPSQGSFEFLKVDGEGIYEIPVGPIHAGIIEPGHFRFSVAGEEIIALEPRLGYTHKGSEKLFEKLPLNEKIKLSEKISGDSSFSHSLAFCIALEKLANITTSKRANYFRVIFAELERLANHFGDIGAIMLDTGFNFGGSHGARLREMIMQINEHLTGNRFLRGINVIGGVTKELNEDERRFLSQELPNIAKDFSQVTEIAENSTSLINRLKGTGVISNEIAKDHGAVGVTGRAAGIKSDVRADFPYAAYGELPLDCVEIEFDGDVYARFRVRVKEVFASIKLIQKALKTIPNEDKHHDYSNISFKKNALSISIVEGWRGEILYFVATDSSGNINRVSLLDPSFMNWSALEDAGPGNIVPDFPLINKSFNLSYSGNDL